MANEHLVLQSWPFNDQRIHAVVEALTGVQIACYIRRDNGISFLQALPRLQLILVNREDLEDAEQILADFEEMEMEGPPNGQWRCEVCGETSPIAFTACWKCGADKTEW